ncbi:MAG: metal-dependent hydrolase [Rhodospirillaceae bacterium]|jgi:inner membrane protein|nr:metal-dependent hydrolase [Rhodospirillaceae bacterium]MBT5048788.1 metal-dependent hydrolase [Rhodospirillaceae bacterium]MBT5895818.1 metal-dependent hydrolase [Rhodospirillaceae bacterium]MBT6430879.1 metal-dependent hydrolase [Rhodospirillaceae bacterium]
MDTLTQIVLGACVGVAVLGRRPGKNWGPRRAAIAGGLLGTLPDLDILVPANDAVDAFVSHRGFSHSLVIQAAVTPLIGEGMVRFIAALRQQRVLTYAAVYLCLATHALLDGMTVYGTKLLWPLSIEPFAVGSIFIIDILYTLPLLVATVWALCLRHWTPRMGMIVALALVLSSAYQVWCFTAQRIVAARAGDFLARSGIVTERMLAIPTPFNSYFWRVMALQEDRYLNIYLPVFGGPEQITVYDHPRNLALAGCLGDSRAFARLEWFSRGYFRLDRRDDEIIFSDLRMGMTPNYVFRYAVARLQDNVWRTAPPYRLGGPRGGWDDVDWLLANLAHEPAKRPAEINAWIRTADLSGVSGEKTIVAGCQFSPTTG